MYQEVTTNMRSSIIDFFLRTVEHDASVEVAYDVVRFEKGVREDALLLNRIIAIHQHFHGTYRAPRVHAELRETGIRVWIKCVARLIRMVLICGVPRRRTKLTNR